MILDSLGEIIRDRKEHPQPGSYVSSLFAAGQDEILKKIGEEAVEVILAAKSGSREEMIHEHADLWFHCMVLMVGQGIDHNDVFRELEERHHRKGKER